MKMIKGKTKLKKIHNWTTTKKIINTRLDIKNDYTNA